MAIDDGLCMYCGICVEGGPFDALFWAPTYDYPADFAAGLVHEKAQLTRWLRTCHRNLLSSRPPLRRARRAAGRYGHSRATRSPRHPPSVIRTRIYRNGNLEASDFDPSRISDYLTEPETVVWMDLCEPAADDFEVIAEEFSLNPLAVEDALHERQRPKLDRYEDHLFLSLYAVGLDKPSGQLNAHELALFVSRRYLITVRKDAHLPIEPVLQRWDDNPDLAKHGVGFLLWGLLDVIVDGHFETVEDLDGEIEDTEDLLFDDRQAYGNEVQRRSFELRKSLVLLRRVVVPTREVVNSLLRRDLHVVDEAMAPYYQDVYDHILRAADWTDSLRDLVSTILETNLTIQGNRMNVVMKQVTSWAAIVAVPTLITGYYGMNVRIFPGAGTLVGGIFALCLMAVLTSVLYVVFRRKDWL